MRFFNISSLSLAAVMVVAGAAAIVSPASAEPAALSDGAYLSASRCAGIAQGLGADTAAINRVVADQDVGREAFISDRAATSRDEAARTARRAGPDIKAHMTAEWNGACQAYLGAAMSTASR